MAFTVHVTLAGGTPHAVGIDTADTAEAVMEKVARGLGVDACDIVLHHEGGEVLCATELAEGSEVVAEPTKRAVARGVLRDMGLGWGASDLQGLVTSRDDRSETVKLLLEASSTIRSEDVAEPLCHAASKGLLKIVEALLPWADIDCKPDGETPLHCACQHGHLAVVRYLVEAGADTNRCEDLTLDIPLDYARKYGQADVASYLAAL